jgi:hypothetical protein
VTARLDGFALDGQLLDLLAGLGAEYERVEAGAYVVTLRGIQRPSTQVWLLAGPRVVAVEAFVLHVIADGQPDTSSLHHYVLSRNLRLHWVSYGLDAVGDVFLPGSLRSEALSAGTLDAVLGEVLATLERDQQPLLRLTYGDRLADDEGLAAKVLADGAGRRAAGSPSRDVRRDSRR